MNRGEPDLRRLKSFVVLADELHFTRAAEVLRVAQPALSQQVRLLEQEVGFRLFDRTSRKVELTAAGSVFLAHVRRMFAELERAVDTGRHIAGGKVGTLTVGYAATAMVTVLPAIVRRFREAHAGVRLLLRELASVDQLIALRRGELDVAIVSGKPENDDVVSVEIWRDPLVALVHSSHAAARKRFIPASALARDSFIMFPRSQAPGLHDQIVGLCRKAGFEPAIEQEAQSWHMIGELVSAGMGVSIAPASVGRYRVPRIKLVPLRPSSNVPLMLCHDGAGDRTLARRFIAVASELF